MNILLFVVLTVVIFFLIVFVDLAERRIPVQYAKRVRGTKMYGGQSSVIPMKISASGVMPLIFAFAIISFPSMIMSLVPSWADALTWWNGVFGSGTWLYVLVLCIFIFAFSFFYAQIQFNPEDVSKNIQQNGGFIQGIRPGKPTAQYLRKINNRITLFGAIFLTLVAFIPSFAFSWAGNDLVNVFSTTGILIVVSVALEFDKQLQSQIMMKNYKGFFSYSSRNTASRFDFSQDMYVCVHSLRKILAFLVFRTTAVQKEDSPYGRTYLRTSLGQTRR